MTKFKEGKIPYFNKLKYLPKELQDEGIAILERAKDNRDQIMYDRFQLKNTQRSIDYHAQRLFELRVDEWKLKVKLAGISPITESEDEDEIDESTEEEEISESNATDVLTGDLYGYGVPDYEGDEDEDEGDDSENYLI